MERVGRLQQAEQVLGIGSRDVTDDIDGEKVVAGGDDATNRRHGLQGIHGGASFRAIQPVFWNTGNPYLFPPKAL
ncbi:hypothetical protein ACVDG5_012175 [Mesorhizobium sp. ORM6]